MNPFEDDRDPRPEATLGDKSSMDIGEGLHIDPRKYVKPNLKVQEEVTEACVTLASLVAYKVLFEACFLGWAMVPQKILMKAMDHYMPAPTDGASTHQGPKLIMLSGVNADEV